MNNSPFPGQRLVVLDAARGNDNGVDPLVEGALEASRQNIPVLLTGDTDHLAKKVTELGGSSIRIAVPAGIPLRSLRPMQAFELHGQILAAIGPGTLALLDARNALSGAHMVRHKVAHALVSMGSTKDAMGVASAVGRVRGVTRPAIAVRIPIRGGKERILLDVGAAKERRSEEYIQLAVMGSIIAERAGVRNPLVALLADGEEKAKGTSVVREARGYLEQAHAAGIVNFSSARNAQGKDLVLQDAPFDVVVADGDHGNECLKLGEGMVSEFGALLKDEIRAGGFFAKLGAWLQRGVHARLKTHYDGLNPEKQGAQPLIGVQGNVFIGHGSAKAPAVFTALKKAFVSQNAGFNKTLEEKLGLLPSELRAVRTDDENVQDAE